MSTVKEIWDAACKETLRLISETFLDPSNQSKADSVRDKEVFQAVGETITNFPIPPLPASQSEQGYSEAEVVELLGKATIYSRPLTDFLLPDQIERLAEFLSKQIPES
jgi:hypothetical protein